jgi:hypothetical protein
MNLTSRRIKSRNYCVALLAAASEAHCDPELRGELVRALGCGIDYNLASDPMANVYNEKLEHMAIAEAALRRRCPGALGKECETCMYSQRVLTYRK